MLGSLPDSYDNFLTSLNARSADDLDWENVKGLLIEEYMKRTEKNEKQESDNTLLSVEENRCTAVVFNHVVELVAVEVAVAVFRILTSMVSPAVMIVINTEVLSASSATRMDIS